MRKGHSNEEAYWSAKVHQKQAVVFDSTVSCDDVLTKETVVFDKNSTR